MSTIINRDDAGSTPLAPAAASNRTPRKDASRITTWPVAPLALAALVDLGMSDRCIARYFVQTPGAVAALRVQYGVPGVADPSSAREKLSRFG